MLVILNDGKYAIKNIIKNQIITKSHEGYNCENGLYISETLDGLFDKGWISFEDNGNIIFADNVSKSVKEKYQNAKINPVFMNSKRKEYLKWNRENWFKKSKT